MEIAWITAFLDTPRQVSDETEAFWRGVTATTNSSRRGTRRQFATLLPPAGDAFLRVQTIESGDAGVHVDLHVANPQDSAVEAVALSANVIDDLGTLIVLRSPGGLPFCLVAHHGESIRPRPINWSRSHCSLVDQVCIDIPVTEFDREAWFWAQLTGWQLREMARPEFAYLQRPRSAPLRLLFQRVRESGPVRAHLDLACDDVPAEAVRHESLGATLVRRADFWTTLRDPAGRSYCITARTPGLDCSLDAAIR